jgi:hypothetical protein
MHTRWVPPSLYLLASAFQSRWFSFCSISKHLPGYQQAGLRGDSHEELLHTISGVHSPVAATMPTIPSLFQNNENNPPIIQKSLALQIKADTWWEPRVLIGLHEADRSFMQRFIQPISHRRHSTADIPFHQILKQIWVLLQVVKVDPVIVQICLQF